jgi:uncharacterized membrane protein HdeD (DUF308 family)
MNGNRLNHGGFVGMEPNSTGWGWILAYGIVLILGGILALMNPVAAGFTAGALFGAMLIAYGVFAFLAGISALSTRARVLEILLGVLAILAGVFVLFDPFQGAASLACGIGLWLFVSGISQIIFARRAKHDRGWRLLLGIIDIVLGAYLLFSGPLSGFAFVAAIVGFSFLFRGFFLVTLSFSLRKLARA